MISTLTETVSLISERVKTLQKVLKRRDLEIADLPAAEALIGLTAISATLEKLTDAVKVAAGIDGPLFDQES